MCSMSKLPSVIVSLQRQNKIENIMHASACMHSDTAEYITLNEVYSFTTMSCGQ